MGETSKGVLTGCILLILTHMGSPPDLGHSENNQEGLCEFKVLCEFRVTSAYEQVDEALTTEAVCGNAAHILLSAEPLSPQQTAELRVCAQLYNDWWSWLLHHTFSRRISSVCYSDIFVKQPFDMGQTASKHIEHVTLFKAG